MEEQIKLDGNEIAVGKALAWGVYDAQGRLLLQKGEVVASATQLAALLARGLYRRLREDEKVVRPAAKTPAGPVATLRHLTLRVHEILSSLIAGQADAAPAIRSVCERIHDLCERDADTMLCALHFTAHDAPPHLLPAHRQVHLMMVNALIARRLKLDASTRASLLAANLTCNVGMYEIAAALQEQAGALCAEQERMVKEHPQRSVALLRQIGVDDERWLAAVSEHHERLDGSGYPRRLQADAISQAARLVSLAETYAAMVSPRSYRDSMVAKDALRELFLSRGKHVDETLAAVFIKELGIFPPGSLVQLVSNEIGLVSKRASEQHGAMVTVLLSPTGKPYGDPFERDTAGAMYSIKAIYRPDGAANETLRDLINARFFAS